MSTNDPRAILPYVAAEYVQIPADAFRRLMGVLEMCGYELHQKIPFPDAAVSEMTPTVGETPRTDALFISSDGLPDLPDESIVIAFARTLERELAVLDKLYKESCEGHYAAGSASSAIQPTVRVHKDVIEGFRAEFMAAEINEPRKRQFNAMCDQALAASPQEPMGMTCEHGVVGYCEPCALRNPGEVGEVTQEMVSRFLAWKLPKDFGPDGGISFAKTYNGYKDGAFVKDIPRDPDSHWWPIGTNLLNADQARAMLEHVLTAPQAAVPEARTTDAEYICPQCGLRRDAHKCATSEGDIPW